MYTRVLTLLSSAVLATGALGISQAPSAESEDDSSAVEAIVEAVPSILSDAVAPSPEGGGAGDEFVAEVDGATVALPAEGTGPITYTVEGSEAIDIQLPGDGSSAVSVSDQGFVVYDSQDGSETVPLPKADGGLQITSVITDADAPTEYVYSLTLPAGYVLQTSEGGGVGIVSEDHSDLLAAVAAPWAVDAEGKAVPTRYEVRGTDLVQIVDHPAGGFAYPIVADPWLGKDLYYSPYITSYAGKFRVNVSPTPQGTNFAGVGTWWAHRDEVVNKLYAKYPNRDRQYLWNNTVQEQFYCHIAGVPYSLPEYNLEASRVYVSWVDLVPYNCNYPEGSWSN